MDPISAILGTFQSVGRVVGGVINAAGNAFCAPNDANCRRITGNIGGVLGFQQAPTQPQPTQQQPGAMPGQQMSQTASQQQPSMQEIVAAVLAALNTARPQTPAQPSPPQGKSW